MLYYIKVAEEYTKTPGGRHKSEGDFSGEDFRVKILKPRYLEAKDRGEDITVDLDGGYGYATSFLEEAFGGLARELHDPGIKNIKIVSNEEPALIEKIKKYIQDSL